MRCWVSCSCEDTSWWDGECRDGRKLTLGGLNLRHVVFVAHDGNLVDQLEADIAAYQPWTEMCHPQDDQQSSLIVSVESEKSGDTGGSVLDQWGHLSSSGEQLVR